MKLLFRLFFVLALFGSFALISSCGDDDTECGMADCACVDCHCDGTNCMTDGSCSAGTCHDNNNGACTACGMTSCACDPSTCMCTMGNCSCGG